MMLIGIAIFCFREFRWTVLRLLHCVLPRDARVDEN
jgi:hypothetical protein